MTGVVPQGALSLMRPNSLLRSRPQTRFYYRKLFVLTLCILPFAGKVCGQSLVVVSGGNTVSQGGTVSINTIPNMPNLVLSVNGGTSCDVFSYQISITYSDQATPPATTGTNVTFNAQDIEGDLSSTVDWFGNFEGGNATITWTFDGVQQSSFNFFVNGTNPPNSTVDSYLSNGDGAWFKQNLVAYESGAYTDAPYNQYHQFVATPYDPVWGAPDGIGLMQLEPPARASGDADFWAWPVNVADGLSWLDGKKSAAYQSWNNELTQMQSLTGGNPVYPPPTGYTYCYFSYPQNGNDSYSDGDWIHYYNGNYFIFFHPADSSGPNRWDIDTTGYVMKVCNAAPL